MTGTEVTISGLCNGHPEFHAVRVAETAEYDRKISHSPNHVALCGERVDHRRPYKPFSSLIRKSRCHACDEMFQQQLADAACAEAARRIS